MSQQTLDALSTIKTLGTPTELEQAAQAGAAPARRPKNNSHIHLPPNFSAFENVAQAIGMARDEGARVVGVSNYYDYSVYNDFAIQARENGIFPLYGLEIIVLIDELVRDGVLINDPGNSGKMYICGKGITQFEEMTPEAARLLGIIRSNDTARMATMIGKLAPIFEAGGVATGLDEAGVIEMVVKRHGCPRESVTLQERHVAQAFQEAFFARVAPEERQAKLSAIFCVPSKAAPDNFVAVQNEIRSHLMKAGKPAFVTDSFINFEESIRLILELGGIPCYPTLADGASPICAYEDPVEKLIATLKANNIYCAEFIPIRNKPEVLTAYVKAMRAAGLVITGGTEHNTLDLIPIEPTCVKSIPVPEEIKEIFWEGACVVAAHQFLTLNGQLRLRGPRGGAQPGLRLPGEAHCGLRQAGGGGDRKIFSNRIKLLE